MSLLTELGVGGGFLAYVTSIFGFSNAKINKLDKKFDKIISGKQDAVMCEALHKQISIDLNRNEVKIDTIGRKLDIQGEAMHEINQSLALISQEMQRFKKE